MRRLPEDMAAAANIRTVLALGQSLAIPVPAEGIETEAQWQFLAREGHTQGRLPVREASTAQKLPATIAAAERLERTCQTRIAPTG